MTLDHALAPNLKYSATIGVGLRHPHYAAVLGRAVDDALPVDFLEVHAENFFAQGGAIADVLDQAALRYPISLHGVGLSLGSANGIDDWHLAQLKRLVDRVQPMLVSDHACFGRGLISRPKSTGIGSHHTDPTQTAHANDLLPIRHTHAALEVLCANVSRVQDALGRRIAVENISAYVHWNDADYSEVDFLNALAQRTGCGVLMDLNNIYVNALNASHAFEEGLHMDGRHNDNRQNDYPTEGDDERHAASLQHCKAWVDAINPNAVMEIHLAGYTPSAGIVIDDHATPVHDPVWHLYRHAVARLGQVPTLIEWDLELPALDVLLREADTARRIAEMGVL